MVDHVLVSFNGPGSGLAQSSPCLVDVAGLTFDEVTAMAEIDNERRNS